MATDSDSNEANGIPGHGDLVVDGDGEVYRREFEIERGCWSICLFWNEYRVGHLYGIEGSPGIIHLNEVFLEDAQRLQETILRLWIRKLLLRPPPTRNFRRRGLGAHLLPYLIEQAKRRGVRRIEGKLTQSDLVNTPFLPAWYTKHGFRVTLMPTGRWAGEIVLELQGKDE